MSKHGRPLHEKILNVVRFKVLSALREEKPLWEVGGVCDEHVILMMLNQEGADGKRLLGSKLPDLILFSEFSKEYIIIEIGEFNPAKWDEAYSVIHIGFNGRVSRVNTRQTIFETLLISFIKEQLALADLPLEE